MTVGVNYLKQKVVAQLRKLIRTQFSASIYSVVSIYLIEINRRESTLEESEQRMDERVGRKFSNRYAFSPILVGPFLHVENCVASLVAEESLLGYDVRRSKRKKTKMKTKMKTGGCKAKRGERPGKKVVVRV